MPPARIHEAIAKKINLNYKMDEKLLRIGTIAPDSWRNIPSEFGKKDKYSSHFWDFSIKNGQANDYVRFYTKYYNDIYNPFYFGYLIHLIVDQYWKTNIDPKYKKKIDGEEYLIDIKGNLIKNENYLDYYESINMQQRLASRYDLDNLPIASNEYDNFSCSIEELNLDGLFGENGSINYTNKTLFMNECAKESNIYDDKSIEENLNETIIFVNSELERLKNKKS